MKGKIWPDRTASMIERMNPGVYKNKKKPRYYALKGDLPVGISERGELITIPYSNITSSIMLPGMSQFGKSLTQWGLIDRMYHQLDYMNVIANDQLYQGYAHQATQKVPIFRKRIDLLHEIPKGLPIIPLYPSFTNCRMPEEAIYAIKIAVNFWELANDIFNFRIDDKSGGKAPIMRAGSYQRFYNHILPKMKFCKNSADIQQLVHTDTPDIPKGMMEKIGAVFDLIISEEITDIDKRADSKLILNEEEFDVISALLKARLVPCIMSRQLQEKSYNTSIIRFHIKKLVDMKLMGYLDKKWPLYIHVDELNDIQDDNIDVLRRIVTEGKNIGLGTTMACQNFSKVDRRIKQNTQYTIAFRQLGGEGGEAQALKEAYSLNKRFTVMLTRLRKFEAVFLTSVGYKLYDPLTGTWEMQDECEPIRGFILPPLSNHPLGTDKIDYKFTYDLVYRIALHYRWKIKHRIFSSGARWNLKGMEERTPIQSQYLSRTGPIIQEGYDLTNLHFYKIKREVELSLQDLESYGYAIVSKTVINQQGKASIIVDIEPSDRPNYEGEVIHDAIPQGVIIKYDIYTREMWLIGEKCYDFKDQIFGKSKKVTIRKKND